MFTTIIMINIKNIFITTGISVLFGVYSIYNILDYLKVLNNHRLKQINSLKHSVNDINKKYNELELKHIELQKQFDELLINFDNINQKVYLLNVQIVELQDNKMINIDFNTENHTTNDIYENPIYENPIYNNCIICDELCDLKFDVPRVRMETMSPITDNIDEEFIESLSLDYDCHDNTEVEVSSLCNHEKYSTKSRTRSTSVTDINWYNLTKKFLFG